MKSSEQKAPHHKQNFNDILFKFPAQCALCEESSQFYCKQEFLKIEIFKITSLGKLKFSFKDI